jgi:hypothetical protein
MAEVGCPNSARLSSLAVLGAPVWPNFFPTDCALAHFK